MSNDLNINICFYQRRYDEFNNRSNFLEVLHRQNHWVSHLKNYGVKVYFVLGAFDSQLIQSEFGEIHLVKDRSRKSWLHHSKEFYKQTATIIRDNKIGLVVCQGLNDAISHTYLKKYIGSRVKLLYQDHASQYSLRQKVFRHYFKAADCITFNSPGQELEWVGAKVFPIEKVRFLPEGTSLFSISQKERLDYLKSKKSKRILWIGDLNSNKDPITVLKALSYLLDRNWELTMIFRNAPLLDLVKQTINKNGLQNRVTLVGKVSHLQIVEYYKTHQFIVSASGKEGSGYSVIEAMSCGVVPILTKIPSFVDFTDNGRVGYLFDRKDEHSLVEAMLRAMHSDYEKISDQTYVRFTEEYSSQAIAKKLGVLYTELIKVK